MPGARAHDVITVVTGMVLVPLGFAAQARNGALPDAAWRGAAILGGAPLLAGIMCQHAPAVKRPDEERGGEWGDVCEAMVRAEAAGGADDDRAPTKARRGRRVTRDPKLYEMSEFCE